MERASGSARGECRPEAAGQFDGFVGNGLNGAFVTFIGSSSCRAACQP